jgi:hypothetical protein
MLRLLSNLCPVDRKVRNKAFYEYRQIQKLIKFQRNILTKYISAMFALQEPVNRICFDRPLSIEFTTKIYKMKLLLTV